MIFWVSRRKLRRRSLTFCDRLVLDTKLEMTVVRVENGVAHVQLALGEKNLNQAVRALFVSTPVPQPLVFDQQKPTIKSSEMHQVQLTTVDPNGQCFHVLLFGEPMTRILNVLKDWNASKQPLKSPPKANTLVCAQYEDGLWYRAWIESITGDRSTLPPRTIVDRASLFRQGLRSLFRGFWKRRNSFDEFAQRMSG